MAEAWMEIFAPEIKEREIRAAVDVAIDAEDAPVVSRYLWYTDKDGFLLTDQLRHRNGKPVKMEELIMGRTYG